MCQFDKTLTSEFRSLVSKRKHIEHMLLCKKHIYQQHRMPRRENLPGEGKLWGLGLVRERRGFQSGSETARKKDTRMAKETGHGVGEASESGIQRSLLSS